MSLSDFLMNHRLCFRNNVGMRLLPLQSSQNNMLNDMVYGTSIQKHSISHSDMPPSSSSSRPSSSMHSNQINKRLPPLRSTMNNNYDQQQQHYENASSYPVQSRSSKHVLFDTTEQHRAPAADAARLRSMSPAPHLNRPFSASNLRRQRAGNPRARSARPPQLEEAMVIDEVVYTFFQDIFVLILFSHSIL